MKKQVKVKPNSKQLIKLLADKFDVPKSKIAIEMGLSSKTKLVEIDLD